MSTVTLVLAFGMVALIMIFVFVIGAAVAQQLADAPSVGDHPRDAYKIARLR